MSHIDTAVDEDYFTPTTGDERPGRVLFVGSMDWMPNMEAINWFIKNVYPKIISSIPNVNLHISGRKMPGILLRAQNKNLTITGEISNPMKFQESKAIMFVPLLSGSGIRAKIVEGMSLGKTIISTSVGARGINCTHNENILIADTPEEFVDQFLKCFSETFCRMIGGNAKTFAKANFDHKHCSEKMLEFYVEISISKIK